MCTVGADPSLGRGLPLNLRAGGSRIVGIRQFRTGGVAMKAALNVFLSCMGLVLGAGSLLAHHSFDAEYDRSKTVAMKGTVTRLEWMNPHTRFYIDVKDANGRVTNWNMELGSPNGLIRAGWTRHSLKVGDQVTVTASLARDGSKMANARKIILADGKEVFGASSAGP